MSEWFEDWFNEDYLKAYPHRDEREAIEQVEAVIELLHLSGKERILDLACGNGRHALEFARRGYDVVGVDLSETLLALAQESAEAQHLTLSLERRDMRDLHNLGSFDLVLSLFTSFGYFADMADNQKVLDEVASCLRSGSLFFLDYLHPHQVYSQLEPRSTLQIEGETVRVTRRTEGDLAIKELHFPTHTYTERVHLYTKAQLEQMLKNANLLLEAVYDDYHGSPWLEEGHRQVMLARKG